MSVKERIYRPIGALKTLSKAMARKRSRAAGARLYLLNVPSHGNMGDHLISVAEQEFLRAYFPEKELVLITSADLYFSIRFALLDVRQEDILCVTGGGFMGSLYAEEERFLEIISRFRDNKIVFFPQSIYYAPSKDRQQMIDRAAKVYGSHKSLYVAARDSSSFDLLHQELMPAAAGRISLVPDIALFLQPKLEQPRSGVLFCLRSDAESRSTNAPVLEAIWAVVKDKGLPVRFADTYINTSVPLEAEAAEVSAMMDKFASAALVVTDRLHGMIFSAITSTPVVVMDNSTGKVRQVYDLWLKDIPYVRFAGSSSSAASCIEAVLSVPNPAYDRETLEKQFIPIVDAINA